MPRGIKGSGKGREPAGEPRPLRRRGRKPKEAHPKVVQPSPDEGPALQPPDLPAQPPDLAAAETEVARKYPHVRIKPGSLRFGATEGWGNKRIVTIVCSACQVNERVVATSDLFHVGRCEECSRAAKKAARKAKKEGRP